LHYPTSYYINIVAIKKWESSNALVNFYPVTGQINNCVGVPITSLSAQNRLYSLNTSISKYLDLGFPLLIGGLVYSFTRHVT
jgi:hypothetical protein